jgi:hypothetical protein
VSDESYKPSDFNRRSYTVEDPALDSARKIEVIVKVDGKTYVHTEAREPGIIAFVSRPKDQGFAIEIVQRGGRRYTDVMAPADMRDDALKPWQVEALGLGEEDPR